MPKKRETFQLGCKSGKTYLTNYPVSSSCLSPSISNKAVKITNSTVISGYAVTLLLHYCYPEASNFIYLLVAPLMFYSKLNQIAILVVPTVLPEHTKFSAPFRTYCDPRFSNFNRTQGNFIIFYDVTNHIYVDVIIFHTKTILSPIRFWISKSIY